MQDRTPGLVSTRPGTFYIHGHIQASLGRMWHANRSAGLQIRIASQNAMGIQKHQSAFTGHVANKQMSKMSAAWESTHMHTRA